MSVSPLTRPRCPAIAAHGSPHHERPQAGSLGRRPSAATELGAAQFPADPVRALLAHRMRVDGTSLLELAATLRLPLRTVRRVQRSELLAWTVADRCAVALGYHPCQLWPQWFGPDVDAGSADR